MKTVKPGQRVLHPRLGPGTVKALYEDKEICYFKPDFVPERFLGLQLVYISVLEETAKACSKESYPNVPDKSAVLCTE